MNEPHRHPVVPKVVLAYAIWLFVVAGISYLMLPPEDARAGAWSPFIFGVATCIWYGALREDKPWGFTMALYTIVVGMIVYFLRGLINLLQTFQGFPEKFSLALSGWFLCIGSVIALFVIFRLTRVKAPRPKK